ncbi:MAG: asparagine synthase (glutamine-hydrolyzing), partial [Chloroflexota bacterium]
AITHRGPDGDGFHYDPNAALGMRRLSIIDIAGSDQPLYSADRSLALVFNGEIYNYRELRDSLRTDGFSFYTDGDGETLIHLYERDGLAMFDSLRGMYAFALWDTPRQRLVLAVDHIGMKPLYLYEHDGMLRFASEVKALLCDTALVPRLRLRALDTYLTFGFQVGEETLFDGVRRLMPGHFMVVENGEVITHRYWRFGQPRAERAANRAEYAAGRAERTADRAENAERAADRANRAADDADVIDQTRDLLRESVRLHLRSDVPLGLFLSGGVDSAAMLALMAEAHPDPVRTFTVGYDTATPDEERAAAARVAAHFGATHHECVISAADWWRGFETYTYHEDEPTANPSAVSLMLLAEHTAQQVKVVLTGLGGDELFGGYPHHRNIPALLARQARWGSRLAPFEQQLGALEPHYPAFKRYRIIGALPTYLPEIRRIAMDRDEALLRAYSFDGMVWTDSLRERLYTDDLMATADRKREVYGEVIGASWYDDPHDTAAALVANTWLHGNALLHVDKVTMAHSLEARVPLFDPVLIDHATQIEPELRLRANKYVLREAMRPYLPDFALNRPKQPFGTPIRGWFQHELRDNIREVLLDEGALVRELFRTEALETVLQNHFDGREKQEEIVFRLLTLELWARRFGVVT